MRITTAQLKSKRAGKPLPRKEGEIQSAILAYLRTVPGVVAWRTNTGAVWSGEGANRHGARFGFKGLSDIIGWRPEPVVVRGAGTIAQTLDAIARFLAIEVKAPGKSPTREQWAFLDAVRLAGGLSIVAHSVDDVVSALGLAPRTPSAVGRAE